MLRSVALSSLLILFGTGSGIGIVSTSSAQEKITYDDHAQAILRQRCSTCHNSNRLEGDLDLTNYTNLMQGGGSGEVILPGDSEGSYLFNLVTHDDEPSMPPDSDPIPEAEIEILQKWIDGGALENKGSKAIIIEKPTVGLALSGPVNERPEVAPMPARLVKETVIRTPHDMLVTSLATSPWAPLVAVAGQHQVLLYHSDSLELLGVIPFPEGQPNVLKFSRNGQLLLVGGGHNGASGRVVVFNVQTGERVIEVGDELDTVLAADISSDQSMIALGGPQRLVRVYSTSNGELLYEITKHTDWVFAIEFSADGVLLATGDRSGGLLVWEAMTGREYLDLRGHKGPVTSVSWRDDSNVLASASEDRTAKTWELENGGQLKSWTAHGGGVASIEFTRDGRLVTCGRDRTAKLWGQDGKQQRVFEAFGDLATAVTFCDETDRVIGGDWTGEVRVWTAADGKRVGNLTGNPETLEERIAHAETELAARQNGVQELEVAANQADMKLTAMTRTIAELKLAQQASAKDAEVAASRIVTGEKQVAELTTKLKSTTTRVQQLETALPSLLTAESHLSMANQALGNDPQVADLSNKTGQVGSQIGQQLEKLKSVAGQLQAEIETRNREVSNARQLVANSKKTKSEVEKELAEIEPHVAAVKTAAEKAKVVFKERQSEIALWNDEVAQWKSELAFATEMQELKSQIAATRDKLGQELEQAAVAAQTVDEKQKQLDSAKNELDAVEEELVASREELDKLESSIATTTQQLETVKADISSLSSEKATLQRVLASLVGASDSVKNAATQVTKDEQVAEAAERMEALVLAKKETLTGQESQIQQQRNMLRKQELTLAGLVASQNKMAEQAAEIDRRRKEVAQTIEQVAQEVRAATATHAQWNQKVDQVRNNLEQLRDNVAQAQGIGQE